MQKVIRYVSGLTKLLIHCFYLDFDNEHTTNQNDTDCASWQVEIKSSWILDAYFFLFLKKTTSDKLFSIQKKYTEIFSVYQNKWYIHL